MRIATFFPRRRDTIPRLKFPAHNQIADTPANQTERARGGGFIDIGGFDAIYQLEAKRH